MSSEGVRRRRLQAALATAVAALVVVAALERIEELRTVAEAASMTHVVAQLRTAVVIADTADAARGSAPRLRAGANPVTLLTRPPWNYVGSFRDIRPSDVPGGRWFFDETQQTLVYRVRHADGFDGGAEGVARARFKIVTFVPDGGGGDARRSEVGSQRALSLRAVEPYRWVDRRNEESERNEE